jgi:hypothetical protein
VSTPAPIQSLATDWYHKLDNHAPAEDYAPLLAGDDLELRFPEGTFRGFSGFRQWYERVLGLFFDESHVIKSIDLASGTGPNVEAKVVVHWEASTWTPPDARSRRIKMDAYQTWIVRPSTSTGQPEIFSYAVDRIEYADGSARL